MCAHMYMLLLFFAFASLNRIDTPVPNDILRVHLVFILSGSLDAQAAHICKNMKKLHVRTKT